MVTKWKIINMQKSKLANYKEKVVLFRAIITVVFVLFEIIFAIIVTGHLQKKINC